MGRGALLALLLAAGCGDSEEGSGGGGGGIYPANYNAALDPFDENVLTHYRLTMAPADWDAMVADPGNNTWRRATLEWEGEIWKDIAVRPSGQRSRVPGNPKPSLRIKVNEFVPGRDFHSPFLNGVKLVSDTNDPSMIRRRIEDGIYRAAGLPAPRCVHARVSVNGVYKGLYGVEERMTRGFIRSHFGSVVHQLYNFHRADEVNWVGPEPSEYMPNMFEPLLDELDPANPDARVGDAVAVRDFVDVVNNAPWATAAAAVDVDLFCRFMAAEVVTGEGDGYVAIRLNPGPGQTAFRSSNFRITIDPRTGKWVVLAWDREAGYWAHRESIFTGFNQRVLTRNLILADPGSVAQYRTHLAGLVNGAGSVASMESRIAFIENQVAEAAAEDPHKTAGTTENWRDHVDTIRTFVRRHNAMIQTELAR